MSLVGAGPGDAGLITVAGLRRLREADVVIYDALANPALLDEAPPHALRIDAGKRAKAHRLTQDQTNALLVEHASAGRRVVRLKGGDPYLFGRGAEEAIYCHQHGVACDVIAGVTSGIAAPAAAGIPVTFRHHASTVTFVTGHEDPTKDATGVDYAALGGLIKAGGTACFYMGVGRLGAISEALTAAGVPADMSVAIVQWGTTPRQRTLRTTLATAAADVDRTGIGAPAIIVVGVVAGIDEPALHTFEHRPLFGQRIIVTRTRQQASSLRAQLEALGAQVWEAPTIELQPPALWSDVDAAVRGIAAYRWLVLTSEQGVAVLAERLAAMKLDARHLAGVRIAAVGEATTAALAHRLGVRADLVPQRFTGEAVAEAIVAADEARGQRVLMLRADIARPDLPRLLTDAGANVTDLASYRTGMPAALPEPVLAVLRAGEADWVTFTSSSTATNFATLLGGERALLTRVKTASIGPSTSQTLRDLGLPVTVEASPSHIDGLVAAIIRYGQASPG